MSFPHLSPSARSSVPPRASRTAPVIQAQPTYPQHTPTYVPIEIQHMVYGGASVSVAPRVVYVVIYVNTVTRAVYHVI